jgi:hypothetical protein
MPRAERSQDVLLTAQRHEGRHRPVVLGHEVWLASGEFTVLCRLAAAAIERPAEYLELDRLVVHRLRKAIDAAAQQSGLGAKLIETGVGTEYRLTVPRGRIGVDHTFAALPAPKFVRPADKAVLLAGCPAAPDPEA